MGKGGRKPFQIQLKNQIKSELCFERANGFCSSTLRFFVRIPCAAQTQTLMLGRHFRVDFFEY